MFDILYTIIIKPLEEFLGLIYMVSYKTFGDKILSLFILSTVVSLCSYIIYSRLSYIENNQSKLESSIDKVTSNINKHFSGEERTFMLQTYYREINYKPWYIFKKYLSIFIGIPFFISAYEFLNTKDILDYTIGNINLSKPDGLISIANFSINLFPIIMTILSIISNVLYIKIHNQMKNSDNSDTIQNNHNELYIMTIIFFIILYNSSSGLVIYWIFNNIYNILKTFVHNAKDNSKISSVYKIEYTDFIAVVLLGLLIPSQVIKASPIEFIETSIYKNPIYYIINTFSFYLGCILWINLVLALVNNKYTKYFKYCVSLILLLNYLIINKNFGRVSNVLRFDEFEGYTNTEYIRNLALNICIIILICIGIKLINKSIVKRVYGIITLTILLVSTLNIVSIESKIIKSKDILDNNNTNIEITLNNNKKNVVVIMLDKAISCYIQYIFNEKPELYNMYDGFVYYPNTLSYGDYTYLASPALFGGYEYTPEELNAKTEQSMKSKHNEALLVLPKIFDDANFNVTVCDPPYAGDYKWIPNLNIYSELNNTKAFITDESMIDDFDLIENIQDVRKENFIKFSLFSVAPSVIQSAIYDNGYYHGVDDLIYKDTERIQRFTTESAHIQYNTDAEFLAAYKVLSNLNKFTNITNKNNGSLVVLTNNTTHEETLLQEPDYTPSDYVDNTDYDLANTDRFKSYNHELNILTPLQYASYQVNMTSILKIGEWLEFLKSNDIYDNTKIIIVADHGLPLASNPEVMRNLKNGFRLDLMAYNPLLLVKDYNSSGKLEISKEFMTNADVPSLVIDGLDEAGIKNINPYTNKIIDDTYKDREYQMIPLLDSTSEDTQFHGNTFVESDWLKVNSGNILDLDNWTFIKKSEYYNEVN